MTGPELPGEPDRSGNVDARRAAETQPLMLEQFVDQRNRFLVGNEVSLVDDGLLDDSGYPAESNTFRDRAARRGLGFTMLEQLVHSRSARIGAANHNVRIPFLQEPAYTGKCAAGPDRANEPIDLPVRLLPDLRARRLVMSFRIVQIVPLIGEQHAIWFALSQPIRKAPADMLIVVWIGIGQRRYLDELGAAEPQHVLLFLALRLRNDNQRPVTAGARHDRKSDTGIAGRGLDHQAAGLEVAALLRLENHPLAGPIL